MAKTPLQVEEAAKLAEELHQRMFSSDEEEVEDTLEEDTSTDEDELNNDEDEVEDEEIEDDVPHDDDLEELRKFKARYLSLKGKYDAEVPTLHRELNEFKQSVVDKLSTLTDKPAQTKVEQSQEGDIIARLKEDYGDDFIDSVKLLAEQIAEEKIKASLSPMQAKVDSVEEIQIKVAQDEFKQYLDENVKGDWKKLWEGKDKGFIEFLSKPDPSGLYTYGELVELYNEKWDSSRLATVLNTYLETKTPAKPKVSHDKEKESMIAPSRTTTHNTPDADDKVIWTKASIAEFQRLDRQGKFSPEESMAKWNDLLAAANEGRIR